MEFAYGHVQWMGRSLPQGGPHARSPQALAGMVISEEGTYAEEMVQADVQGQALWL